MLKAIGNICKVDRLGRIVIPVKIRKMFDLAENSPLELFVEDDKIVFKKYLPQCTFCLSHDDLVEHKGHYVCKKCIEELSK
ncbi:MAG: AbrB/MazE/SpoVT family DNA-binding domain-containing protein [Clostridia bacterium]|nr:AbrB/MazE/SpoVT family DNA-binding domain-containing protein [Clostridia bacterium]